MFSIDAILRRWPTVLLVAVTLLLAALAAFGVRSWLVSRDALTRLTATLEAQKQVFARAAEDEQQRNAALAKTLLGISNAKRQVKTPADVIAELPNLLPSLPEPISLTPAPMASQQPTLDVGMNVPQADLKPLYDYAQDCRACDAKLAAAQGDLVDERSKVAALTKERDAATKAVKGTFLLRVKRAAKWLAIGAALGAIAAESAHR